MNSHPEHAAQITDHKHGAQAHLIGSVFCVLCSGFPRTVTASLLIALTLAACRADEHSARGVADRFVDQHYVEINLAAAKPFCTGLALKKVEDEQRLTAGQPIDESTRKPSVHYRLVETKEDGDTATFVYEGTIRVEDAGKFMRKWMITTRRTGERWMVSNFEEFD